MTEPDELYTLRAQYWLGHYNLAVEEAKSIARRPMSPALKAEREEILNRAYIALGQYDKLAGGTSGESLYLRVFFISLFFLNPSIHHRTRLIPFSRSLTALDALVTRAKFEATQDESALDELRTMAASSGPSEQLTAAQVLLSVGQIKEALSLVHLGATMEHIALALQIFLKMDRLDLATQQLQLLRQADEDAILTQLGSVYVNLASGSSGADGAIHSLNMLTEQYGPSSFLLNLMACALMNQGDFAAAEGKLQECLRDHPEVPIPDTLVNLVCCLVQQNKQADQFIGQMQQAYPTHDFCAGLERVTTAFDREAIKYKH